MRVPGLQTSAAPHAGTASVSTATLRDGKLTKLPSAAQLGDARLQKELPNCHKNCHTTHGHGGNQTVPVSTDSTTRTGCAKRNKDLRKFVAPGLLY